MASQVGIGQDKIQQALQLSTKYPKDIQGLKQVINDNGGVSFLEKALKTAENPLLKPMLKKIGVTPDVIAGLKKDLGYGGSIETTTTSNNNILERLKNLK